jgi:hypothetical protein
MIQNDDPARVAAALARDHLAAALDYRGNEAIQRAVEIVAGALRRRDGQPEDVEEEHYAVVCRHLPDVESQLALTAFNDYWVAQTVIGEEAGYTLGLALGRTLAGGR